MPDKAWKSFERRVGKRLGGRRIPVTGIDRYGSDVTAKHFEVQCKLRRGMPAYLREWLDGIVATTPAGKTGIVVWKEPGALDANAAVVLRLQDFEALLERWEGVAEDTGKHEQ